MFKALDGDYVLYFRGKDLKNMLHIANAFHLDGTLWVNGRDNSSEIVNVQEIKTKIKIPIISSNIKEVEYFKIPYDIEKKSIRNCGCDIIVLIYSSDKTKLSVIGTYVKDINVFINKIEKVVNDKTSSGNMILDDIKDVKYNFNHTNNIMSKYTNHITFVDVYNIDHNDLYISNSLDISNYKNIIGIFVASFNHFTNFISKTISNKCSIINIKQGNITGKDNQLDHYIELSACNVSLNISLRLTYKKIKEEFLSFNILSKYFESIKHINISIDSNTRKDKRIYNELLFEVAKVNNIYVINMYPNNIKSKDFNSETIFISIPSS